MPDSEPILLLPGLGADTRMFDPLRAAGLEIQTPPWIDPLPCEPLAEYAARFAAALAPTPQVIGGASFGGMVALEMARRLRPHAVILLGSCASPDRLAPGARLIERLSRALPTQLVRTLGDAGIGIGRLGPMDSGTRALLLEMIRQTPVPFLRWGARAILAWPGVDSGAIDADLLWVHGARDRVVRPSSDPRVRIVQGAGHLVSMTHPRLVTRLIQPT